MELTQQQAPFTTEQVENLNKFQGIGFMHPFTCDRKAKECEVKIKPRDFTKDGVLIALKEGWICPCGKYSQNWAHTFMTEPLPDDVIPSFLREPSAE